VLATVGSKLPITLIIPPSPFLLDERVFVNLGVLRVAAVLEANGHCVSVLDLSGIANFQDALLSHLDRCGDRVFGISATTPQLPATFAIARAIRRHRPEAKLILGGPHVTLTMAAVKLERKLGRSSFGRASLAARKLEEVFDVLCAGDGELAVLRAIQPDSPKLLDGDDNHGNFFLSDKIYEAMPRPARHLVDLSSYHYSIDGSPATSLIAQLGCPFNCGFCGGRNSKSLRVVRTRSTASIVDEVEYLHRTYGHTGFMFYDDELNVSKSLVKLMNELADLQERLGVEFRLRGFIKAELFRDEQARAMHRAGFRWLLCGFEAADPRILTNIQKRASLDDNTRAVEIAKRHDLKVKALMSIGHPGESERSVAAIQEWLVGVGADDFDCTIITTYPGTPYYDFAVPHGRENVWVYTQPQTGDKLYAYDVDFTAVADYYKGDPDGGYKSFVFTDYLSNEQLVTLRDEVERNTRRALGIPFNASRAALRFEHSMGQGLPDFILRTTRQQAMLSAG
jgi:radical SAM superfamily enzyme YgiQ (UPF0313 family)